VLLVLIFSGGRNPGTNVAKGTGREPRRLGAPITNTIGMKLMLIPTGTFTMGSPESETGRFPHESPQHEVTITKSFYMGVHEVTVGQFRTFVQETKYKTDAERGGR